MRGETLTNSFQVSEVPWNIYKKQKKNQVFKLLPLKEEGGDWRLQLTTLLIEFGGIVELTDKQNSIALTIMFKLAGLLSEDIDFYYYRKTVFEVINLLEEW